MLAKSDAILNIREKPESVLIELARGGNDNAYAELVRRSWDVCMRVAISSLGNRDEALDEVQDAFLKAYLHLGTFKHQSKFSTWVARIVINHCLMRLREKRRLRLVPCEAANSSGEEYTMHEGIDNETPEDLLGCAELYAVLRCELNRIPILLRVPLELRYIQGMGLEALAQHLNITIAAAKSRLHRAHSYLRVRMIKHCGVRGVGTLTRAA